MKVRELIEQLQACDPDADVLFVYNHSRTDVAAPARYAGPVACSGAIITEWTSSPTTVTMIAGARRERSS